MIFKFAILTLKYRKRLGMTIGKLITFFQFRSYKEHTAISRNNFDKKNSRKINALRN